MTRQLTRTAWLGPDWPQFGPDWRSSARNASYHPPFLLVQLTSFFSAAVCNYSCQQVRKGGGSKKKEIRATSTLHPASCNKSFLNFLKKKGEEERKSLQDSEKKGDVIFTTDFG